MKNRFVLLMLLYMVMLFVFCGCAGSNGDVVKKDDSTQMTSTETEESEENMVVLNDRQKQILRDKGLPEDYEKLTASQKNAIVKIEGALSYLEETYKDEFEYEGYVSGGLDGEYVTAKIVGTLPEKVVTVYVIYKDGSYSYSDNYEAEMAEEEYKKEVTEFLSEYFDPSDFQVYVNISELGNTGESIVERAKGVPIVLINNVYAEEEVTAAANAYAEWIAAMENKDGGGADFKVYNNDVYMLMNEFNYRDYMKNWIYELDISVYSDKSTRIERYEP